MRNAIVICLMLYSVLCGCARQQALPDVPWRAIVAKEQASSLLRWKGDVNVKLFGAFTHEDSLMVVHSLAFFNVICQTANFSMTEKERGGC